MSTVITAVDLRVDPICPWAWLTSRWLVEVERVRDLRVRTRLFCLADINRGEGGKLKASHEASIWPLRVLVAARREGGDEGLARLYTEIGEAIHERGEPVDTPEMTGRTLRAALGAAGFDASLAAAALGDATTLDELAAEHTEVVERGAFGVPTLEVAGHPPLFGPVIDTRIRAEAAGELWDHVAWTLQQPSVLELKRDRPRPPDIGRNHAGRAAA